MSSLIEGLNPAQQQAVTYLGTPLLVLAGAGSGKTRVLTHRAAFFVAEGLARPSEIVMLTFTNKAAEEMKHRMQKLLDTNHFSLDTNLFAGTFHSFCCRILRADGHHLGLRPDFAIYDANDQEDLVKLALIDLGFDSKEFKPSSILYFIENAKNHYLSPDQVSLQVSGYWESQAAKIYHIYQQKITEYHALDFNDLLFKTAELFIKFPEVLDKYQNKYRYFLVDEYQDTNQIQYLLTKLLSQKFRQITVVGDASQAIYGWRGADYHNLISFTTDFSDAKVINLEQNYRSTQIILDAANSVISKNNSHPVLKLFTEKKSTDKIKIYQAQSEIDEAEFISSQIEFARTYQHLVYKDIAVLYRTNAQSRVLEESFLKHGLPYVLIGGLRFYERAEIKDILSLIRYAADNSDKISENRVKKALGVRRKTALDTEIATADFTQMKTIDIMEKLVLSSQYLKKFDPKDEEDQHRIENIKELKSVASQFPNLLDFLENIALVQQEYSLQEKNKKNDSRDGIRLMTIHSSKGLEFDLVFIVGFEEGILPHSQSMIEDVDVEEERRLCYVALTRAKDYLFLSFATHRLFYGKSSLNEPSRFLADIPDSLLEFISPPAIVRDFRHPKSTLNDLIYDPDIY